MVDLGRFDVISIPYQNPSVSAPKNARRARLGLRVRRIFLAF